MVSGSPRGRVRTRGRSPPETGVEPDPSLLQVVRELIKVLVELAKEQGGPWSRATLRRALRDGDPRPLIWGLPAEGPATSEQEDVLYALRTATLDAWEDSRVKERQREAERNPLASDPTARTRDGRRVARPLPDKIAKEAVLRELRRQIHPERRGRHTGLSHPGAEEWVARLLTMDRLGDQAAESALGGVASRHLIRNARRFLRETMKAAREGECVDSFKAVISRGATGTYWDEFVARAVRQAGRADPMITRDRNTWDRQSVRRAFLGIALDDYIRDRRDVREGKVAPSVIALLRDGAVERLLSDFSP